MSNPSSGPSALHQPPTGPQPKPRGILKNAPSYGSNVTDTSTNSSPHLTWDEANLLETEIQKDSLMKITEPKTPYVRYNAETDEVEGMSDIPPFNLDGRSRSPSNPSNSNPVSPTIASPPLVESDRESRRASFGNPSSRSSGSASSSRRTSFNLPEDARIVRAHADDEHGDEIELDEEMDEETAARHAAFVRARGRHYSNEAEAMKRAQQLMAHDDEEVDEEDDKEEDIEVAYPDDDGDELSGEGDVMTRIPGQNGVPPLPAGAPKPNGITRHDRSS